MKARPSHAEKLDGWTVVIADPDFGKTSKRTSTRGRYGI
jgi:hypothetical protein